MAIGNRQEIKPNIGSVLHPPTDRIISAIRHNLQLLRHLDEIWNHTPPFRGNLKWVRTTAIEEAEKLVIIRDAQLLGRQEY